MRIARSSTTRNRNCPGWGPRTSTNTLELGLGGPDQERNLHRKLRGLTEHLRMAPMKPQQKIWALKTSLLPRLLHQALFAEPTTTTLKTLDRLSRQFTRKLLHLPKDTPLGAFHASKSEGGLGISFITGIPALKKKKLTRLAEAPDNIVSQAARSEPRPTSVPPSPRHPPSIGRTNYMTRSTGPVSGKPISRHHHPNG